MEAKVIVFGKILNSKFLKGLRHSAMKHAAILPFNLSFAPNPLAKKAFHGVLSRRGAPHKSDSTAPGGANNFCQIVTYFD